MNSGSVGLSFVFEIIVQYLQCFALHTTWSTFRGRHNLHVKAWQTAENVPSYLRHHPRPSTRPPWPCGLACLSRWIRRRATLGTMTAHVPEGSAMGIHQVSLQLPVVPLSPPLAAAYQDPRFTNSLPRRVLQHNFLGKSLVCEPCICHVQATIRRAVHCGSRAP